MLFTIFYQVANVVGVDLSQKEIQEAIKRLHELRSKARGGVIRNRLVDSFNARFLQSDSLGRTVSSENDCY